VVEEGCHLIQIFLLQMKIVKKMEVTTTTVMMELTIGESIDNHTVLLHCLIPY
jgi:hypothetical protein